MVVDVDPETQRSRLQRRNGLDTDAADARIAAQANRQDRLAAADVVLDNSGGPTDLIDQVDRLWSDLRARATTG